MIELNVVENEDEFWIKIPKSIMHEKIPRLANNKLFAFDTVDGIELKAQYDENAAENEDYKLVMKANNKVLKRLAET